jgi:hypothetical protein
LFFPSKPSRPRAGFVPLRLRPPDPPTESSQSHHSEGASPHSQPGPRNQAWDLDCKRAIFGDFFLLWRKSYPPSACEAGGRNAFDFDLSRPPPRRAPKADPGLDIEWERLASRDAGPGCCIAVWRPLPHKTKATIWNGLSFEAGPPSCRLRPIPAKATRSSDGVLAKPPLRRGQPAQPVTSEKRSVGP